MYSFIILDINNKVDITYLNQYIQSITYDYEILYCSSKEISKINNVKNYIFKENTNSEVILNTVVNKCKKDRIIVVRNLSSCEDLKTIVNSIKKENQVVAFKNKSNKVKNFFRKIFNTLSSLFFNIKIHNMNLSIVGYGSEIALVIKNLNSPSNAMRINDWKASEIKLLEGGSEFKIPYKKTKFWATCLSTVFISIVSFVLFIVLKSKLDSLLIVLLWSIIFICLIICFTYGINWYVKCQVGETVTDKSIYKGE